MIGLMIGSRVLWRGSGETRGRVGCGIGTIWSQKLGCSGCQAGLGWGADVRQTGQEPEAGHRLERIWAPADCCCRPSVASIEPDYRERVSREPKGRPASFQAVFPLGAVGFDPLRVISRIPGIQPASTSTLAVRLRGVYPFRMSVAVVGSFPMFTTCKTNVLPS